MSGPDSTRNPVLRMFGALLMAVGAMIGGLCGLCTASLGLISLVLSLPGGMFINMLGVVLVTGVLPTAIGFGVFYAGRKIRDPDAPPLFRRPGRP